MTVAFFLAAACIAQLAAAQNCPQAQNDQAKACFQTWVNNYNIAQPYKFQDLINARVAIFNTSGVTGFDKTCVWQMTLETCLAGVNLDTCLTKASWKTWFGVTDNDSASFRTWYYLNDYECTDGKAGMDNNLPCIMQAQSMEANDLNSCYSQYIRQLNLGVDPCKAYNQYISCSDNVYVTICGPDVKQYICKMDEIGYHVNDNTCDKTFQDCAVPTRPPTCTADMDMKARSCFQTWINRYGLSQPYTFQDFINARVLLLNQTGVKGLDQACDWQTTLDNCISYQNVNLDQCLTPTSYQRWFGVSAADTGSFRTWYYLNEYECTDGKAGIEKNFDCLLQVQSKEVNELNSCLSTYTSAIQKGVNVCTAYNDYITCVDNAYVALCGPGVKEYICSMDEIGFKVNDNQCDKTFQQCKSAISKFSLASIVFVLSRWLL